MKDDDLLNDLINQKAENIANMREIERLKARAISLLKMVSDLTGQLLNANDGSALEDTLKSLEALDDSLSALQARYDHEVNERVLLERKFEALHEKHYSKPTDLEVEQKARYVYLLENEIKNAIGGGDQILTRLKATAENFAIGKVKEVIDFM